MPSSLEPEVVRELLFSLPAALQFSLWVVGATMDITERKQAEDASVNFRKFEAELAEKLRDVIEAMPTMVWVAGTDGANEFANHHWQEYTGLSHEGTVGSAWQDVVHPADLKRHLEKWCASRASGEPFENEVRYRRAADGQYRWFLSRAVPLRNEKGEIVKWYGVSTDIEDRKRAEERLRESEAYLAEAQRLSQTGSWAWSPATGDIRYWSETCFRVLGFDPAGPLPRFEEFFGRIHPDDQAPLRQQFDDAIREKTDCELDYRFVHPEKGIRDIHAVGHVVLDASGDLLEVIGTVMDVTERKRAEQELRQTEADLRTKNDRLNLLLNVTNQITSNLELRDLLRAISTNIRGVMQCDMVALTVPDGPSEGQRLVALDFPHGKGLIREGLLLTPVGPGKKALETLKPTRISPLDPDAFAPEVREAAIAEGLQRYCVIPLATRGRALGALVIGRMADASSSPDDLEFLAQVSGQIAIAVENALAYREISQLKDRLTQEKLYLEEEIRSEMSFENIVGNSPALKHVLKLVETVAPNDSTVLILGETGTGKELLARAIHDRSRRTARTFVKLNCAAIPTGLLESELFGHEKGAFTGAIAQKIGRLELADQGTLFLDEVGDIPTEIQPKLLRALQEREFERLGSTHTRKVNIRLIAATNRNLETMVAEREFRSDLFYRLNVFPIRIPALRERKEDIPLLVSFFVQKFAKQMQKEIASVPSAVMKGLVAWEWPGNIRELENFIERAVILTRGKALEVPLAELRKTSTDSATDAVVAGKTRTVRKASSSRPDINSGAATYERKQREEIIQALTACKGLIGGADGAAVRLGINRTTLMYRMRKLGIYAKLYS